jgi:hypothetical protein
MNVPTSTFTAILEMLRYYRTVIRVTATRPVSIEPHFAQLFRFYANKGLATAMSSSQNVRLGAWYCVVALRLPCHVKALGFTELASISMAWRVQPTDRAANNGTFNMDTHLKLEHEYEKQPNL